MINQYVLPNQDKEDKSKPKNYMEIVHDLFVEGEITKQEYVELKKKYEKIIFNDIS
jgi:hypothetical protein